MNRGHKNITASFRCILVEECPCGRALLVLANFKSLKQAAGQLAGLCESNEVVTWPQEGPEIGGGG